MRYADYDAVNIFWLIAAVIIFLFWAFKRRKEIFSMFAEKEVLEQVAAGVDHRARIWKQVIKIAVLLSLGFALMRPQWGFQWQEVNRKGVDIYIAVDVSKSMLAEDIKPNRLERTKLAIKDFVSELKGDRIGLIAFAGSAFIQCPLTVDYSGFFLTLNSINVDSVPRGGTDISAALKKALKGFGKKDKKYNVLILITDGENHQGYPLSYVDKLKEQGVKVYAIGIGTEAGELIPIVNEKGNKSFLKDREGNVVKSRLDDKVLKDLALKTGGSYIQATNLKFGLNLLYDKKISKLEQRNIETKQAKRYEERFQIFLLIAFILLCIEMCISTYKKEE